MIAVSSFRPLNKCTPVIAANQIAAHDSWCPIFDKIIYLGDYQQSLNGKNTEFIKAHNPPAIHELAYVCATQKDWSCLINADIIVSPRISGIEHVLRSNKAKCAVSFRWPRIDSGLDFFAACPLVWRHVASFVPKEFKIGHILFDTWLLAFFMNNWPKDCYDLTPSKVIFHPIHQDRLDQSMDDTIGKALRDKVMYPFKRIT